LPSGMNASIRTHDALLRHCTFNKGDASFLTELKRPGSGTPLLKGSEGGKSVAPTPSFFELGFAGAEVYFMVKKMVQRMLEDAGQQLGFEVHRKESQAGVDSPSAGHDLPPICWPVLLANGAPDGQTQGSFSTALLCLTSTRPHSPCMNRFFSSGLKRSPPRSGGRPTLTSTQWSPNASVPSISRQSVPSSLAGAGAGSRISGLWGRQSTVRNRASVLVHALHAQ
jgi:hypothetical protein